MGEETLGQRLRRLRLKADMSMEEVARRINVTFSSVGKYERDEQEPRLHTLRDLARLFGVSIAYLLGEDAAESVEPGFNPDLLPPRLQELYRKVTPMFRGGKHMSQEDLETVLRLIERFEREDGDN